MATRIAVMEAGRIVQAGTPMQIYTYPQTHYVADFVGAANFLPGVVTGREDSMLVVRTEAGTARVPRDGSAFSAGDVVELFFRPEHCKVEQGDGGGPNRWRCSVEQTLLLGPNFEYVLQAGGQRMVAWTTRPFQIDPNREGWLSVDPGNLRVLAKSAPVSPIVTE
jgi:ABC-type Fe3+/spermidine/putrescine transport system ATPase subunit